MTSLFTRKIGIAVGGGKAYGAYIWILVLIAIIGLAYLRKTSRPTYSM